MTAMASASPSRANLDDTSDGGQPHDRLFLPTLAVNRVAATRELTDGLPTHGSRQRARLGTKRLPDPATALCGRLHPQDADDQ